MKRRAWSLPIVAALLLALIAFGGHPSPLHAAYATGSGGGGPVARHFADKAQAPSSDVAYAGAPCTGYAYTYLFSNFTCSGSAPNPFATAAAIVTVTPEPTTPTTVQMESAQRYGDAFAFDPRFIQVNYPNPGGNFSDIAPFVCYIAVSQNGASGPVGLYSCLPHGRLGLFVENTGTNRADINYLGAKGVGGLEALNTGDADADITAAKALYNNTDEIITANEINANNYAASIYTTTSVGDTALAMLGAGTQFPFDESSIIIEPGSAQQEIGVITSYTRVGGSTQNLNSQRMNVSITNGCAVGNSTPGSGHGVCFAHPGNINTHGTLAAAVGSGLPITAANPTSAPSPQPFNSPSYIGPAVAFSPTPYPTFTPNTTPSTITVNGGSQSSWTAVASANGYITIDCASMAQGQNANTETFQVTSETGSSQPYTLGISGTPVYAHANNADVRQSCIQNVPQYGYWGAMTYGFGQTDQAYRAVSGTVPVSNPSLSSQQLGDAFSPFYGGFQEPISIYNEAARGQEHYCGVIPCLGFAGDGTTGVHGSYWTCATYQCPTDSFQSTYETMLMVNGNTKPWDCTECAIGFVPVGQTQVNTSTTAYNSLPEDAGVSYIGSIIAFLHQAGHGSRWYWGTFADGDTFCDFGLIYLPSICSDNNGGYLNNGVSVPTPKMPYYTYMDMHGLFDDPQCRLPGCSYVPATLTWNWSALPTATAFSAQRGTSPSQIRSVQTEDSYGDFKMEYAYEALHYRPGVNGAGACADGSSTSYATTHCYQWCGSSSYPNAGSTYATTTGNTIGCWTTNFVAPALANAVCKNYDTDISYSHTTTRGHMIPTSTVTFNSSGVASLTINPEPQMLVCPQVFTPPSRIGTNSPSPAPFSSPGGPAPAESATPDPTPTPVPSITAVPSVFS